MLESSTGFRVTARAREVIAIPRSVAAGIRTRACPLCAERTGAGSQSVAVRRRAGAASALGLVAYATLVAVCALGAEWLWYHTDRIGAGEFKLLLGLLESWPLVVPALAFAAWAGLRIFGARAEVNAPLCGLCRRDERRSRARRVRLVVAVGAASTLLGVLGLWALQMPPLWALVVAAPVVVVAGHGAARLWPPAVTWLGKRGAHILLEVSPSFARVLIEEPRVAAHRAARPRGGRLAVASAVACLGLFGFLLAGDHPVCPIDTEPTRTLGRAGEVVRGCVDREGDLHGRFIQRSRWGRVEVLGGASHGVASGWWFVDGAVYDGFDVERDRRDLVELDD